MKTKDKKVALLGNINKTRPVKIIGGGFSGLSLAFRMKQLKIPFTLVEKNHLGGKIKTEPTSLGPVESAASTLYLNKSAVNFLSDLKLTPIFTPKNLRRLVWKETGPSTPFSASLAFRIICRLGSSLPPVSENSSVEEVFLPLLGKKYVDEILSPALQGIYSAEARDLHFLSLFPFSEDKKFSSYYSFLRAFKFEVKKQQDLQMTGSVSFKGGMDTLIQRLRSEVQDHIVIAEGSAEDNLALCTNAQEASKLLHDHAPFISSQLARIKYLPVSSFTFFTQTPLPELNNALGMLVPQKSGHFVLGVIAQSNLFPENYPSAHCYRVICKGNHTDQDEVLRELSKIVKGLERTKVLATYLHSWREGLPLYDRNRFDAIKEIQRALKDQSGLLLLGNYTGGIGLRSIIEQSQSLK